MDAPPIPPPPLNSSSSSQARALAIVSLVLGIIGLPASCAVLPPVLAIIFGIVALVQATPAASNRATMWMAISGIVLGVLGTGFAAYLMLS